LDSGAFYRAVTLAALDRGIPPEQWDALSAADLHAFEINAEPADTGFALSIGGEAVGDRIRSLEVNAQVARMAALPPVRAWLLDALRAAGRGGGLVADGRDIGTVVFPEAELKIFLICEPEERARRRLLQQGRREPDAAEVRAEASRLVERDRIDESRAVAPLRQADDAVILDTTPLSFDEQVRAIATLAAERAGA
ncbi:MAG: (d)CMP kinase, partial [Gemmatimonadota bacterium]